MPGWWTHRQETPPPLANQPLTSLPVLAIPRVAHASTGTATLGSTCSGIPARASSSLGPAFTNHLNISSIDQLLEGRVFSRLGRDLP